MNLADSFIPSKPLALDAPWLQLRHNQTGYVPHLFQVRRRSFSEEMIRSFSERQGNHKHDVYHMLYFFNGANEILVANNPVEVRAGQLVLIDPDVFHSIAPARPDACEVYTFLFTYQNSSGGLLRIPFDRLIHLLTGVNIEPGPVYHDLNGNLGSIFSSIEEIMSGSPELRLQKAAYCLGGAINELTALSIRATDRFQMPEDILGLRKYMARHLKEDISIQDLIDVSSLSRSTLMERFKKYCGVSPIDFLINARLERAKTFLVYSDKSIKEIAWECGFNSPFYFNKMFKKRIHITPGCFRKSAAGEVD